MHIELTEDEALVLFDLLADYAVADEGRVLPIRSAAERNALWAVEAALERSLVAPFRENYAEVLKGARSRLIEQNGDW
jgi:hypothetical protein